MQSSLDSLLKEADRAIGLDLSFESISPSILRTVSIRGFKARSPRGATILSAGRVRVFYSLDAIARGNIGSAIREIRIENALLDLDLDADKDILERLARFTSGPSGGASPQLSISGRDIVVKVAAYSLGNASLSAHEFDFSPKGGESEFSLSGEFDIDQRFVDLGSIHGPISVSGRVANDLSRARLELGISARSREFQLDTQRFEAHYEGGRLELRKVQDKASLDTEFSLDLRDGSIEAKFLLDGYAPERAVRASGKYAWLSPWLATPYTGRLAFSLPAGDVKRVSYGVMIEGDLPAGLMSRPVGASIVAKGDFEQIDVERAFLRDGPDELDYSGSFRFADLSPDGTLGVSLVLRDGALPIQAKLKVLGLQGEYAVLSEEVDAAGIAFRDLAIAAARRGDQVDFRASFLLPESSEPAPDLPPLRFSGEAVATAGTSPLVRCEGSASWGASPSTDLSVSLDSVDLGPLKAFLEALLGSADTASTLSGLRLGGDVYISSDFKRLSWSAPDLAVVSRSVRDAYALLSLAGNLDSVSVSKAVLSVAGIQVQGKGKVNFAQANGIGFDADLAISDVPYTLHGNFENGLLNISGDYSLAISARRSGDGVMGRISAKELPLPIAGVHLLVNIDADGSFTSKKDWQLAISSLSVMPTGEGLARIPVVSVAGAFNPQGAQLNEISATDKYSSVSGAGFLEYDLGDTPSYRLAAALSSKSGPESYDCDLKYVPSRALVGRVAFQASPLARFGELPLSGSADGSATVSGSLADPKLSFEASLRGAQYADQALAANATGVYDSGVLAINDASVTYLSHRLRSIACSFSMRDASAKASFSYSGLWGGETLTFSFSGQGSSRSDIPTSFFESLDDYGAQGTIKDFKYGAIATAEVPLTASITRSGASLEAGTQGELSASYGFDGSFDLRAQAPLPIRLAASGKLSGTTIDLVTKSIEVDLPIFSFFFAPKDFQILSGKAVGSFSAKGLAADPEIQGRLDATGVSLKVPGWVAETIGPFDIPILAEGRGYSAYAPSIPVGKATISLRGQAGVDHWAPSALNGVLKNIGGAQVSIDASLLGILVKGTADVELNAELRGDTVFLGGRLGLGKASVLVSPEVWATKAANNPNANENTLSLSVDIDVGLGRGVQVLFPSKDFPIVSGYADRGSALRIRYDQAANDLLLKGNVALRGGDVFYIQRNFFLKSAKMAFNESIERFDPRITVLAELRDRNDSGPVLITLSANNAHITSFQPHLSSDPTMTEAQIAALLGQNLLGMDSESSLNIGNALISGSEFIPQLNVTKAFENRVREALGLDIFYIKTQVLQRLFIDLSNSSQSSEASAENPLSRYLDETNLYAGKYLGDSVFVHGSARLSEDEATLVSTNDLQLDLEFGAEFDTPFGLLQWTVTPNSPESIFIRDQSISISWKLAY